MSNISKISLNGNLYNLKDTISGYATTNYVDTAIGAIKGFDVIICSNNADTPAGVVWTKDGEKYVGTLSAANAQPRTFYMVYQEAGSGNDYYDEYLAIGSSTKSWEKVGNTHIDLSNYYTKSEVNSLGQGILTQANAYTDTAVSSKQDKATLETDVAEKGFTKNVGTITGITMNGASKGTSGVVNLGTVLTEHQDISGKQDKSSLEADVAAKGFTKNAGTVTGVKINGTTKSPTSGVVDIGTVITSHQDISGKENTSNKVTSIASTSTDTQYPSAKAVYTAINEAIGAAIEGAY